MTDQPVAPLLPALPYIGLDDGGTPYLVGSRCRSCGEVHVGTRSTCPKCTEVGHLEAIRLAGRGRLYAYTIVARSFPGIEVPFVAATVDLDGGGTIKGNLVAVLPDPALLRFDMPVKVRFEEAARTDAAGRRYLTYVFVPDEELAR